MQAAYHIIVFKEFHLIHNHETQRYMFIYINTTQYMHRIDFEGYLLLPRHSLYIYIIGDGYTIPYNMRQDTINIKQ